MRSPSPSAAISLLCLFYANAHAQAPSGSPPRQIYVAGVRVKVLGALNGFRSRVVEAVIPDAQYSRENLVKVWRYFCDSHTEKYTRLYLHVSVESLQELDKRDATAPGSPRCKRSDVLAAFSKFGDCFIPTPGDNELLIYAPDLAKPGEMLRVLLAGIAPCK